MPTGVQEAGRSDCRSPNPWRGASPRTALVGTVTGAVPKYRSPDGVSGNQDCVWPGPCGSGWPVDLTANITTPRALEVGLAPILAPSDSGAGAAVPRLPTHRATNRWTRGKSTAEARPSHTSNRAPTVSAVWAFPPEQKDNSSTMAGPEYCTMYWIRRSRSELFGVGPSPRCPFRAKPGPTSCTPQLERRGLTQCHTLLKLPDKKQVQIREVTPFKVVFEAIILNYKNSARSGVSSFGFGRTSVPPPGRDATELVGLLRGLLGRRLSKCV